MGAMTATEPTGLPPRPLTVADLEDLPDDGHRYELLDGTLLVSPAPVHLHQRVVMRLVVLLTAAAPAELEVLPAPLAVRPHGSLPRNQQGTELQPDVVVAREDSYDVAGLPGAPLLAVEVLSPSTRLIDLNLKRAAYERMGVPSYWVVDPQVPRLDVLELDGEGRYRTVAEAQGDETVSVTQPFAVVVRPSDLVRDRAGRGLAAQVDLAEGGPSSPEDVAD